MPRYCPPGRDRLGLTERLDTDLLVIGWGKAGKSLAAFGVSGRSDG